MDDIINVCKKCGSKLAPEAQFCDRCGERVGSAEEIEEVNSATTSEMVKPFLYGVGALLLGGIVLVGVFLVAVVAYGIYLRSEIVGTWKYVRSLNEPQLLEQLNATDLYTVKTSQEIRDFRLIRESQEMDYGSDGSYAYSISAELGGVPATNYFEYRISGLNSLVFTMPDGSPAPGEAEMSVWIFGGKMYSSSVTAYNGTKVVYQDEWRRTR